MQTWGNGQIILRIQPRNGVLRVPGSALRGRTAPAGLLRRRALSRSSRVDPIDRARSPQARGAVVRRRRRVPALEQLQMELGPERARWSLSRLVTNSKHRERIMERVEFVRRFFPEIESLTIRLGLAQKRGVLGGVARPRAPRHLVSSAPPRLLYGRPRVHNLLQARGWVRRRALL